MLVLDVKRETFYRLGVQYVRTLESYAIIPKKNNPPQDRVTWNLRVDGVEKQHFASSTNEYKELEAEYQRLSTKPVEIINEQISFEKEFLKILKEAIPNPEYSTRHNSDILLKLYKVLQERVKHESCTVCGRPVITHDKDVCIDCLH
jgi:uncharacterized protein YhaN